MQEKPYFTKTTVAVEAPAIKGSSRGVVLSICTTQCRVNTVNKDINVRHKHYSLFVLPFF